MANPTKYFVLVSTKIPHEFDVLDASGEHGLIEGPESLQKYADQAHQLQRIDA